MMKSKIARVAWALAATAAAATASAQSDDARARKIISGACFLCHGAEGESSSELFPRLAGQHWEYTFKQLENFKSGKRKSSTMSGMVAPLSTRDMVALARYFEKKKPVAEPPRDPQLAAAGQAIYHRGNESSGVPACAGCHGPEGAGSANLPRLAGQFAGYIEAQLRQFGRRERTNDNAVMHAVAEKMTPAEMAAVAEYLSGK